MTEYNRNPDTWRRAAGSTEWTDDEGRTVPVEAVRAQLDADLSGDSDD